MSLHLSTFLRVSLAPPALSFSHLSSTDYTFSVAGLQVGVRESGGLAFLEVRHDAASIGSAAASLVPEPSPAVTLLAGLLLVAWLLRRRTMWA